MKPIPDYSTLYGLFPDADGIPAAEPIPSYEIPEPYRALLVHHHHMTVTVENFYGDRVDVRVLDSRIDGSTYSRKILLELAGTKRVVQFGIVTIDLDLLSPVVREQIISQSAPLGRVLIENGVLREVHPTGYLKVSPHASLRESFRLAAPTPLYGRVGVITADGRPAIEVLEILAPVPSAS
jgi:hypothetical protein